MAAILKMAVVHLNFFLMASTFDIRGGPMNNKNLVQDCPVGGGARSPYLAHGLL